MEKIKVKNIFKLVLEPIALGILALLFIIPTITVINLQPITKKLENLNVLGVSNTSELQINIVEGSHQIFRSEKLQDEDGKYTYTTSLLKREADNYSKPILEIINKTEEDINLEIYGGTDTPTGSNIGLIVNDQMYRLQSQNGEIGTQKITVTPMEKYIVFLSIESFSNVQFEEEFTLNIKVLE